MAPRLEHAGAAPPHRPEHFPPANPLAIDGAAADALVTPEQVLVGTEATDRTVAAEAPGPHAEVAEILGRVAPMDELPIQHGPDPVLSHDQVAEAEVAVQNDI